MILKNGSKGEEVKKLQRKLGVSDTGNFGPLTEAAVKKWQKENGLVDDGIVTISLLEKLGITLIVKEDVVIPKNNSIDLSKLKGDGEIPLLWG